MFFYLHPLCDLCELGVLTRVCREAFFGAFDHYFVELFAVELGLLNLALITLF